MLAQPQNTKYILQYKEKHALCKCLQNPNALRGAQLYFFLLRDLEQVTARLESVSETTYLLRCKKAV